MFKTCYPLPCHLTSVTEGVFFSFSFHCILDTHFKLICIVDKSDFDVMYLSNKIKTQPSRHNTSNQCFSNVGPPSTTLS